MMGIKNVLLIMADQLRRDTLHCYGNDYISTPHLDALAADGIRYERCYTANPLCMPSRHSIISGMYPHNHGIYTNGVMASDEGRTLMHWLRQKGWQTASIGKMHFEPTLDADGKGSREAKVHWAVDPSHKIPAGYWGFEYIRATIGHSVVTGNYRKWFLEHGGTDEMFRVDYTGPHTGGMHMPAELHCSAYIGEEAKRYLRSGRERERPFFMTVSFPDPHFPFTPPKELVHDRKTPAPAGGPEDLKGRHIRYRQFQEGSWTPEGKREAAFAALADGKLTQERIARTYEMTELMDQAVGRIITALKEEGLYEETAILFLSDHGELLGDHGLWFKGPFLYEGLINVPLLCVDHVHRGKVSERLVSLVDIAPAVCELLGISALPWADGQSFLSESFRRNSCLVEYRNGYRSLGQDFSVCAYVTETDKLIRYDDGFCEFTDLVENPDERENQAQEPACRQLVQRREGELLSALMGTVTNRFEQICPN